MKGRSRADMKGWPRANFIIFFEKGLYYRANMKGRSRAGHGQILLIFFEKGLYRADMKGWSRADMKGWPRANFINFFLKRACIGPI